METGEPASRARYQRVILKLSGEALKAPGSPDPIDPDILDRICAELKEAHEIGVEIGIVVGGGNIFRGELGAKKRGVARTTGDTMGMLATVINGLALMDCLEKLGVPVRVQSAIPMDKVAEPFIQRRATRHLEKRRLVIFVAGTGNPYFSTDTTAALRGSEINAEVVLKATKVDGVYDKDPMRFPDAVKYDEVSFNDTIRLRLNVMDSTAFALCRDNAMPIVVFSMAEPGSIVRAVRGDKIGTLVH